MVSATWLVCRLNLYLLNMKMAIDESHMNKFSYCEICVKPHISC